MTENPLIANESDSSDDDELAAEIASNKESATRSYYYDDACGYEVYSDDEDESSEPQDVNTEQS